MEEIHHPDQRLTEYRSEDEEDREVDAHFDQTVCIVAVVEASDALSHRIDSVSKRHERIQIVEKARRQLYWEGAARARHLNDQKNDAERLSHISQTDRESIHDI